MKVKLISLIAIALLTLSCSSTSTPAPDGSGTGGCEIFPADNPWNTDISAYPVHSNSANYIASIGTTAPVHADFGTYYNDEPNGFRYVIVPQDQEPVPITFDTNDESDAGPYPIPDNPPIEAGSDHHLIVLQQGVCKLWEVFAAEQASGGWHGGSGVLFDLSSNELRMDGFTSADAAGLPIFPGLVRLDEVQNGEIRHALRITVPATQKGYIHPATHQAGSSTDPNLPPMGLRVRLKANVDLSSFSANVRVILKALQTYGAFVADNGSAWYVSGVHDPAWDDDELHEMSDLHGSDFEAVETGGILE